LDVKKYVINNQTNNNIESTLRAIEAKYGYNTPEELLNSKPDIEKLNTNNSR